MASISISSAKALRRTHGTLAYGNNLVWLTYFPFIPIRLFMDACSISWNIRGAVNRKGENSIIHSIFNNVLFNKDIFLFKLYLHFTTLFFYFN